MTKKVIKTICDYASLKNVIVILAISFILQYVLVAKLLPVFLGFSGGLKNPDQLFGYGAPMVNEILEHIGTEGRKFYSKMLWIDNAYTLFTGIGFCLLLGFLVKKEKWYILLPISFTVFDLLENTFHMYFNLVYPSINSSLVNIASISTILKHSFGAISILIVLFYLFKRIFEKIRK